ncbi:MAG: hypothetical protein Q8Q62_20750 [Mesorhizobium sp.]|nr:hypothetical protein [Mesorhizobium sp.]
MEPPAHRADGLAFIDAIATREHGQRILVDCSSVPERVAWLSGIAEMDSIRVGWLAPKALPSAPVTIGSRDTLFNPAPPARSPAD